MLYLTCIIKNRPTLLLKSNLFTNFAYYIDFTNIKKLPMHTTPIKTLLIAMGLMMASAAMGQGIIRPKTVKKPSAQAKPSGTSQAKATLLAKVARNMVYVEGGTFYMGATSPLIDWEENKHNKPVHQVTVSSFYISKYEVTQDIWKAVMGTNPSWEKGNDIPVYWVQWVEAQKFVRKLNALTGKHYRLPTEAEWEYAARGGKHSHDYLYSGSNNIDEVAWYGDNSGGKVHPVGLKKPNELGLYDMTGNVREWCSDWISDYTAQAQTNPKGPQSGTHKIYRGGGAAEFYRNCCVHTRWAVQPNIPWSSGLRLACDRR